MIRDWTEGIDLDGLIRGVPEDAYFGDETALSASSAKVLLGTRSPEVTAAMELGSLTHKVLLEPHLLDGYTVLRPPNGEFWAKGDGTPASEGGITRTKQYADAAAKAVRDGLTAVSAEDWDKAHAMAEAVREHPLAAKLLDACGDFEVSAWADHESGARVRGRLDALGPGLCVDLKTANNADPSAFGKRAAALGYAIQAANYQDVARACGWDVEGFAFIVAESVATPSGRHRVSVIELTDRAIAKGREDFAEACRRWLAAGRVVDLPDYPNELVTVDLPPWAYWNDNTATEAGISADFEWSIHDYA